MIKYTSINTIFAKLIRENLNDLDEAVIIELIGEALEAIGVHPILQNAIRILTVKNHQVELPYDVIEINQLAYYNYHYNDNCDCGLEEYCDNENCKKIQTDSGIVFILGKDLPYHFWSQRIFEPIRLTTNNFFNNNCNLEFPNTCRYEYTIIEGKILRFNFKEGHVIISYKRLYTDENGYPMIPDEYSVITAIVAYIRYKKSLWEFYNNTDKITEARLIKAENDWKKYCSQASAVLMIPKGIDEMENIKEMMQKWNIDNPYKTFFRNLANNKFKV